jgi:uncharacterized protein YgbK (DUF1537 family)
MLIVADDLSGAADCGVTCVGAGLKTVVVLKDHADDSGTEVLSVDADTRGMEAGKAAQEVGRLDNTPQTRGFFCSRKSIRLCAAMCLRSLRQYSTLIEICIRTHAGQLL